MQQANNGKAGFYAMYILLLFASAVLIYRGVHFVRMKSSQISASVWQWGFLANVTEVGEIDILMEILDEWKCQKDRELWIQERTSSCPAVLFKLINSCVLWIVKESIDIIQFDISERLTAWEFCYRVLGAVGAARRMRIRLWRNRCRSHVAIH